MSPDEVLALLQLVARQHLQIAHLEATLAQMQQAQQQQEPPSPPV